jgi:hypothetical protein
MSRSIALWWGAVAAALIGLSPWAPDLAGNLWGCTFKALTGLACPTCGTTRAALALARFDVHTALTHYPLPALGWILFLGGGLAAAGMALAGRTPPAIPTRLPGWARAAVVSALLLNWAYSIATGV